MTESILQLLQWLVPTGGVGMLLGWITSTRLRQARTAKEVHDTYKEMYEGLYNQVIDIANDNSEMRQMLARLERAITKGTTCRIWSQCPIRHELQRTQDEPDLRQLLRYPQRAHRGTASPRDPPRGDDDPTAPDPDPPDAP